MHCVDVASQFAQFGQAFTSSGSSLVGRMISFPPLSFEETQETVIFGKTIRPPAKVLVNRHTYSRGGGSSIVKVPGDVPPSRVYFLELLV